MHLHDMQLLRTDDGSYTLIDPDLQESYHSKFGALTESDQVYLRNSGVYQRLLNRQPTSILEIGFGTGFNFVHTASHAIACNCQLSYTACELAPLRSSDVLKVLYQNSPDNKSLCDFAAHMLDRVSAAISNNENSETSKSDTGYSAASESFDHQTDLHLIRTDATSHAWPANAFDAIYLDAFSVKNNPTLWSAHFLKKLHRASRPECVLATYCVSGNFRAALTDAGFGWQKLKGPIGKREVLVATAETPRIGKLDRKLT